MNGEWTGFAVIGRAGNEMICNELNEMECISIHWSRMAATEQLGPAPIGPDGNKSKWTGRSGPVRNGKAVQA